MKSFFLIKISERLKVNSKESPENVPRGTLGLIPDEDKKS
jgi:hypothetical protein